MGKGRGGKPAQLPEGFGSWREVYDAWERFRTTEPRTALPSRGARFSAKHNIPEWTLATLTFIFRTAERDDDVGEYARQLIVGIDSGKVGISKANNEIRAFARQNPRFRDPKVQRAAMEDIVRQLEALGVLANAIRNFSPEITDAELGAFSSNISRAAKKVSALRNRLTVTINERKEGSQP